MLFQHLYPLNKPCLIAQAVLFWPWKWRLVLQSLQISISGPLPQRVLPKLRPLWPQYWYVLCHLFECSNPAASVGFSLLYGLEEVVQAYFAGANLNEDGTHRSCQSLELIQSFRVPMRLYLPEVASMLVLLPSFVPLTVGHFLEFGKNRSHQAW